MGGVKKKKQNKKRYHKVWNGKVQLKNRNPSMISGVISTEVFKRDDKRGKSSEMQNHQRAS